MGNHGVGILPRLLFGVVGMAISQTVVEDLLYGGKSFGEIEYLRLRQIIMIIDDERKDGTEENGPVLGLSALSPPLLTGTLHSPAAAYLSQPNLNGKGWQYPADGAACYHRSYLTSYRSRISRSTSIDLDQPVYKRGASLSAFYEGSA